MRTAAGGLIDGDWCFERFSDVLAGLPPIVSTNDVLVDELLLVEEGPITVRYCPFDFVNTTARLVIVGITPGLYQMFLSCREAQQALAEGLSGDDVLRRTCAVGSFAGAMRTNLVAMLDGIGVADKFGLGSTGELFGTDEDFALLHSTSAILYPAFKDGGNYGGSPPPDEFPILRAFVDQVFTAELRLVPNAMIVPLGRTVASILRREVDRGLLDPDRCLFDFPHPSGQNGHRARLYDQHRVTMAAQVQAW